MLHLYLYLRIFHSHWNFFSLYTSSTCPLHLLHPVPLYTFFLFLLYIFFYNSIPIYTPISTFITCLMSSKSYSPFTCLCKLNSVCTLQFLYSFILLYMLNPSLYFLYGTLHFTMHLCYTLLYIYTTCYNPNYSFFLCYTLHFLYMLHFIIHFI